ncbi:MAG: CDP-glucose 4,6-dehydratase, partial [Acidobacteriota bacterium]
RCRGGYCQGGECYRGGDWAQDRLVPDFVRAVTRGETLTVRNAAAVRPWQHVLEPLRGYLLLAQQLWSDGPRHSEAWNFGPGDECAQSVQTVVETLASSWGGVAGWRADASTAQAHEAHFLKLDCSKARTKLGWHPRWGLRTALESTVAWYKAHQTGRDMRAFTLEQIASYASQRAQ